MGCADGRQDVARIVVSDLRGWSDESRRNPLLPDTVDDPRSDLDFVQATHGRNLSRPWWYHRRSSSVPLAAFSPIAGGALDFTDARYISRRVSKDGEGSWSAERKQIVRDYLTGLAGDFARVSSLARIVDSLSLRASKRTRLERIWLMLRFRILYRTILLSLWRERCSKLHQVGRLTGYVGSLSALGETAMFRLELMSSDDEVQSDISV